MTCSPEDGDLVSGAPKVAVPERGRGGGADADPLGRRRSRRARGCSTRRRGWRGRGANMPRAMREDPAHHLSRTFDEVGGYDEIVLLKDIPFQSPLRASSGADHRQGVDRLSARATRWSESPSWRGCCTALRGGCRCRSG